MKIVRQANGQTTIKLSREEWKSIGKTAGWEDEWGEELLHEDDPEFDDNDAFDDDDDAIEDTELDPLLMKEIERIEKDVEGELGNESAPIPDEIKTEQRKMKKKDPVTWAAERAERAEMERRQKNLNDQKSREKTWEREVWNKPPIE